MKRRILLADDHQMMRDGIRALLERQQTVEVIGEADTGRAAVELAQQHQPDVVVMDIGMPDLNGIEATHQIRLAAPRVKVIALSMHSDKRYVIQMLEAGAAGYLLKNSAFDELFHAIEVVLAGKTYLSPQIADVVVQGYRHSMTAVPPARTAGAGGLTRRQREVLQLLAEGRSSKEIAAALRVAPKTVETHRRQISEKLNIHGVAELTKYAIREGLTSLEG